MQIKNIADLFVVTLEQAGVKRIYEIVGDSLNGLTEALRSRGTIEWVHVQHEEVTAFAAAGEAEIAGNLDTNVDLKNPDFAAMARAMGIFARGVDDPGDVPAAMKEC